MTGGPYDPSLAPDGIFDAQWLDAAVPDRPVALQSTDHHCAWVNTAALRLAGIDEHTPDPPAGHDRAAGRRHADGDAGRVDRDGPGAAARAAHDDRGEASTGWPRRPAMLASRRDHLGAGGRAAPRPTSRPISTTAAAGRLSVRVDIALRAEPGRMAGQRGEFAAARAAAAGVADGVGAHREVLRRRSHRGGHGRHAGAVHRPAAQLRPAGLAAATSWPRRPPRSTPTGSSCTSTPSATPASGHALDAVEHVARVNGPRDRRPVIAHAQLVDPADLPRFAAARRDRQPRAAVGPARPAAGSDLTLPRLGARAVRAGSTRSASLLATGAVLSMGSDWPVSSHRPLDGLAVAVTRQTRERRAPAGLAAPRAAGAGDGAVGLHRGQRLPVLRGRPAGRARRRRARRPGVARARPARDARAGLAVAGGAGYLACRDQDGRCRCVTGAAV